MDTSCKWPDASEQGKRTNAGNCCQQRCGQINMMPPTTLFFCQKSMHKPARLSQGLVISTSQSFMAQPVCICPMTIKHEQDIQLPAKKKEQDIQLNKNRTRCHLLAYLICVSNASGKFPTVPSSHAINYKLRRWAPKETGSIELNLKKYFKMRV